LGIPLSWITPSGLKFTPHYLKSKQTKLAIRIFGKTKKIVLKESIDKLSKTKQNQAIIPNIIHSLDANHLINLLNSSNDQGFAPIITIHDCVGIFPNKRARLELEHSVKKEFIFLYTNSNFLNTFHDRIIQSITDKKLSIIEEKCSIFVLLNDQLIKKPELPELGKLDLQNITFLLL
jgi:Autographiviridae RNA polymerase